MKQREHRILLVGGGHVHLDMLRRQMLDPQPDVRFTLISMYSHHHYSGMSPGYLSGQYREEDISFDLDALAGKSGVEFVKARVAGFDPAKKTVLLEEGQALDYDLVSFNVGSRAAGGRLPGVQGHAQQVKPISEVVRLRERLENLVRDRRDNPLSLNVVGAGSAGVEVACSLNRVLRKAPAAGQVAIFDSGEEILKGYSDRFRKKARQVSNAQNIRVYSGKRVKTVGPENLELLGGGDYPSDLTVWLTGPEAPRLFQGCGLPLSEDGFLLVDRGLRSVGDSGVFAVGDCATLADFPETPKAGVYAVREAPVLWESLLAAVAGTDPPVFTPQDKFLSILNTADNRALLYYKGLVSHSSWAWRLKDWIDRRFMAKYQALA